MVHTMQNKFVVALGIIGSAAMALASISPEDAISNSAGWAKYIGIDQLSALLTDPRVDKWVTAIGAMLVGSSLTVFVLRKWPKLWRSDLPINAHFEEHRADNVSLIEDCRKMVAEYMEHNVEKEGFREYAIRQIPFMKIEKHLTDETRKFFRSQNYVLGAWDNPTYPPLVGQFLREIDRIEAEWEVSNDH